MVSLKHRGLRLFGSLLIVSGVVAFWVLRPVRETDLSTGNFAPLHDDVLAARFAPVIRAHPLYGAPERILYRMAKNTDTGETHIAYHIIYPKGENPHRGFGAFMSRAIYTGGLHLKSLVFGPADIELIEVILGTNRMPSELLYDDVREYRGENFSVRRQAKSVKNPPRPFCFESASWNHLFALAAPAACSGMSPLQPVYFSDNDWGFYKMVKKTEAILRRNRVHRQYERQSARQ